MAVYILNDSTDPKDEYILTHPSHWMLLYYLLVAILGAVLIIPFFYGLKKMWDISTTYYYFYEDRLVIERGLIFKEKNDIQWYRIKSFNVDRPLMQQLFGLGTFNMITSDRLAKTFELYALPNWNHFDTLFTDQIEYDKRNNSDKELNHFAL